VPANSFYKKKKYDSSEVCSPRTPPLHPTMALCSETPAPLVRSLVRTIQQLTETCAPNTHHAVSDVHLSFIGDRDAFLSPICWW